MESTTLIVLCLSSLLTAGVSAVLGMAGGIMLLAVMLLPLGTMRLLLALGRDPRMGLMAFALAWDHNMYWGFLAFHLGLSVALFAIAYAYDDMNRAAPGAAMQVRAINQGDKQFVLEMMRVPEQGAAGARSINARRSPTRR